MIFYRDRLSQLSLGVERTGFKTQDHMTSGSLSLHWLDRYANNFHAWRKEKGVGDICFNRPIGLVEAFFDKDVIQLNGRSDVHSLLNLEVRTCLGPNEVRRRILLAWANLRIQH